MLVDIEKGMRRDHGGFCSWMFAYLSDARRSWTVVLIISDRSRGVGSSVWGW